MTTIASNLREMAGDTRVVLEGIGTDSYASVKIFVAKNAIYGIHGENVAGQIHAIDWLQQGSLAENRPEPPKAADWHIMELSPAGLAVYNTWLERDVLLNKYIAIGSGRKVAMYCMKILGMSPAEAVREACRVDDFTDMPIYTVSLTDLAIKLWRPKK